MITLTKECLDEHLCELEAQSANCLGICQRGDKIDIDGIEIKQSPSLLHDSTGAMVWQSSIEFAQYLPKDELIANLIYDKVVVELGCGTGALARLIGPMAKEYYATDQKQLLKLARYNTEGTDVKVVEFDWEADEWSGPVPECIITCDTIYNEYLVAHLIDAIQSIRNGHEEVAVLLVLQIRELEMLSAGFELLLDTFTVKHYNTINGVSMYILN